jgi:hypothetical protein
MNEFVVRAGIILPVEGNKTTNRFRRRTGVSAHKSLIGHNIPREEKNAGRFPAHAPYASDLD